MNCDEAEIYLNGMQDDELDAIHIHDIEQHLNGCRRCRSYNAELKRLREGLRGEELYYHAPADLQNKALNAIKHEREGAHARLENTHEREGAHARLQNIHEREGAHARLENTHEREGAHARLENTHEREGAHARLLNHVGNVILSALNSKQRWVGALAVLIICVVGASLLIHQTQDAQIRVVSREILPQEIASSHIRSLMPGHLFDVASTDQHTVKPWFNGRLDYSPPVIELKSSGYPLAGGRLDYVDNRTVATLVYRRNKHIINLFIWPSSDVNTNKDRDYQGYHIANWRQEGMSCWVVSDLNWSELRDFVKLYQSGGR